MIHFETPGKIAAFNCTNAVSFFIRTHTRNAFRSHARPQSRKTELKGTGRCIGFSCAPKHTARVIEMHEHAGDSKLVILNFETSRAEDAEPDVAWVLE